MMSGTESDTIQINFEDLENQDNRAPTYLPVEGYIDLIAGLAILRFIDSNGIVQFQLKNMSGDSCISRSFMGTGIAMIPFSCSSDQWKLTLIFPNGEVCIGYFTITDSNL